MDPVFHRMSVEPAKLLVPVMLAPVMLDHEYSCERKND
jgi:hypothetical protein